MIWCGTTSNTSCIGIVEIVEDISGNDVVVGISC